MLFPKRLIWLRYCLLLISLVHFTSSVNAGKSKWQKKVESIDSFMELGRLKRQCFNRVTNGNFTWVKKKERWQNRLIKLEELARDTKRFTDAPLIREESKEVWPKSLIHFTFNDLKVFEARCLRMIGCQDLLLTKGIWVDRLQELKPLLKKAKPRKNKLHKKQLEKLDNCAPYKIRRIYINTRNPQLLDLHGVASAQIARRKVIEFINAAKSKRKTQVLIITGKGNHSSYKNRQGVLFKTFPSWIKDNKNVSNYKIGKGNGRYVVSLSRSFPKTLGAFETPPQYVQRKLKHVRPLAQQVAWEKKYGKSDIAYQQMSRELIRILDDARRLQEIETAYSRDEYLTTVTRISCKENQRDTIEFEEEEIISSGLKKPCLEDFLSRE
jgi:DNA-nicking Smr family endonuclease